MHGVSALHIHHHGDDLLLLLVAQKDDLEIEPKVVVQRRLLHGGALGAKPGVGEAEGFDRHVEQPLFLQAHMVDGYLGVAGLLLQAFGDGLHQAVVDGEAQHSGLGFGIERQPQVGIDQQPRRQRVRHQHLVDAIRRRRDEAVLVLQIAQHKAGQVKAFFAVLFAHSALKSSPNKASSYSCAC